MLFEFICKLIIFIINCKRNLFMLFKFVKLKSHNYQGNTFCFLFKFKFIWSFQFSSKFEDDFEYCLHFYLQKEDFCSFALKLLHSIQMSWIQTFKTRIHQECCFLSIPKKTRENNDNSHDARQILMFSGFTSPWTIPKECISERESYRVLSESDWDCSHTSIAKTTEF